MPQPILALVRDLIFVSKITATARTVQREVQVIRNPASLLPDTPGQLMLLDLNLEGSIPAAASWLAAKEGRRAIGFVSHTDAATISRAREAGITQVMARSSFTQNLTQILTTASA